MGKIEEENKKKLIEYLKKNRVNLKQYSKRDKDIRNKPSTDK